MNVYEAQPRFTALFSGLQTAFGYNSSPPRWVKRPPRPQDWVEHLTGRSPGMGIAPLRPDNTVLFAAIDLDEPDFAAAREMQGYIPGTSWVERSKSGNAHVWVFFKEPLEAWIAMGILREATLAAGKEHVEVFPKNYDFDRVKLGNYINLPYHGNARKIIDYDPERSSDPSGQWAEYTLKGFIEAAEAKRINPDVWRRKADWLMLTDPAEKRGERRQAFGTQSSLHICAKHILSGDAGPIVRGHRAVVFFALAKQLTNCSMYDHDEALDLLRSVNEDSPDPSPDSELRRILANAEQGMYTSTGCDDPLFVPYAHPACPIAHPDRRTT